MAGFRAWIIKKLQEGSNGLICRFKKTSKESLLGYLQNSISDNSSLEHIVSVFEEMCNMPLKEDMIFI